MGPVIFVISIKDQKIENIVQKSENYIFVIDIG